MPVDLPDTCGFAAQQLQQLRRTGGESKNAGNQPRTKRLGTDAGTSLNSGGEFPDFYICNQQIMGRRASPQWVRADLDAMRARGKFRPIDAGV